MPPEPYQRVALAQQEAVACLRQIVAGSAGDVGIKQRKPAFIAAIDDIEKQDAIGFGAIDGTQYVDVGDILNHATRILGSKLDVLDDRVSRKFGIDLAKRFAGQPFVRAYATKAHAAECGLRLRDLNARDAGLGGAG